MVNLAMDAPKSGKIISERPNLFRHQPPKPYYLKIREKKQYETVTKTNQQVLQESKELKKSRIIGHIYEKVQEIVSQILDESIKDCECMVDPDICKDIDSEVDLVLINTWKGHCKSYKKEIFLIQSRKLTNKKLISSLIDIVKQNYIRLYEENVLKLYELWLKECTPLPFSNSMGDLGERVCK
jgi:hypothetical protein